jgi:hypothetical protein
MTTIFDLINSNLFETTYSEYISYYNKEDRVKSAYDIFNHLFKKFNYIFNDLYKLKELESSNLQVLFRMCDHIDHFRDSSLNEVDTTSDFNYHLKNIQNCNAKQDILIAEFIFIYIIYDMHRFSHTTEQGIKKSIQGSLYMFRSKFYQIQKQKLTYQNEFKQKSLYVQTQKQTKHNLDILYKNNLICKDVSNLIYQYLV